MPLNRFIALIKPYLNVIAGALAAWLIAKANVLHIPGLGEHGDELTTAIAAGLAWLLTQGVTQLGDLRWLRGHHLTLMGDTEVQVAGLQAPSPMTPPTWATYDPDHDELMAAEEELPSDDEEFATPPPDASNMPLQQSQAEVVS